MKPEPLPQNVKESIAREKQAAHSPLPWLVGPPIKNGIDLHSIRSKETGHRIAMEVQTLEMHSMLHDLFTTQAYAIAPFSRPALQEKMKI